MLLEEVAKSFPVDEINRRGAIPGRLPGCFGGEVAGRNEQALVASPCHRAAEIPDLVRANRSFVALALEVDGEAHKREAIDAAAVDPSVARPAGDACIDEPRGS